MGEVRVVIAYPEVFSYGAMLIGGVLKSRRFKVKLLNSLNPYNIISNDVDVVGLSLTSILHLLAARETVLKLKSLNIPVIVGGPITQIPELVFYVLPEVDVVVVGEGEKTTPEVLEAFVKKWT
ncbi:MAG: cobalamin-dependent protein [Candidatus Bathyarchaeota archaeon]